MIRFLPILLALAAGLLGAVEERTLTVGTKVAPPFVIAESDGRLDGISVQLMERIAQHQGWTLEWRAYELDDLLSAVAAREVDAGIAAISVTAEREREMDFSYRYFTAGLGIATGTGGGDRWLGLLKRLISWQFLSVLLALGAVLLASGFLVWLFERRRNEDFAGPPVRGIGSAFWWSAVTMTTVGYGDMAPKTIGGRLVALCWMFASVIVISTFTASIATSLTLEGMDHGVNRLDDLDSRTTAVVRNSPAAAELDARGLRTREVGDLGTALDLLESGEVAAVVHDRALMNFRIDQDERELRLLDTLFAEQGYAIALPSASPLREPINQILLELHGAGEIDSIIGTYLP